MDPVAVANLALGWLGQPPISAIDGSDPSPAGQLLFQQFAGIRDAVLEARDWTFATKRYVLPLAGGRPPWGWTSQFQLPAEVLRVITAANASPTGTLDAFAISMALDEGTEVTRLEWVKEGRMIFAGSLNSGQSGQPIQQLNVKAIVQIEDSSLWSPTFCQALAARIAADLCISLLNNRALQADLWKLYDAKLRDAASNDGRQGRLQRRVSNTLATRRK